MSQPQILSGRPRNLTVKPIDEGGDEVRIWLGRPGRTDDPASGEWKIDVSWGELCLIVEAGRSLLAERYGGTRR